MNNIKNFKILFKIVSIIFISIFGLIIFIIYFNNKKLSNYENLLGRAIDEYEIFRYESRISECELNGPFLIDLKTDNKNDTIYVLFEWNKIIEKDTFWIRYRGYIKMERGDGIFLSDNIENLIDSCRKWNNK